MAFTFGDLHLEEEFGPGAVEGRSAGLLKEALVHEVRAPFVLGIYPNLLSLGLSGWIRSRARGIVTSTAAFLSAAVVWAFVHWQ